jgi:uncharacterized protein (DUF1800 family)
MVGFRFGLAAMLLGTLMAGSAAAQTQPPSPRARVQHALRRLAFSAPPDMVSAVMAQGLDSWLAAQENPNALNDTGSQLETLPTSLNAQGGFNDLFIFERAIVQHMVLTPRQLQAKLELHWLDHFAVGTGKVGDPAVMYHYDQTVRANALGNFTTLLTAVAQEAAMMVWLDNSGNVGPVANENFARESMQLFSEGLYRLNQDGSQAVSKSGQPIANYSEADVQAMAKAMTGYAEVYDMSDNNPQTRVSVQFFPAYHYTGALRFLGAVRNVPDNAGAIAYVMNIVAHQPSVAPYEARELLQRFVTETPSPGYIKRIAAVWKAEQDAPDQIAQVMTAIVRDPEFMTSYHAMPKQPIEMLFGMMRQMPGAMQLTSSATPGTTLLVDESYLLQRLLWPETVFSFYRPGQLSALTTTGTVLARTGAFALVTNADPSNAATDTYIDMPTLRARIGNASGAAVMDYLMDALLDGGTQAQRAILLNYLGDAPSDTRITGAIWLLLNTPDYAVN